MTLVSRTETLMASVPTFCPSTCLFSSRGGSERLEQDRLPLVFPGISTELFAITRPFTP